MSATGQPNMFVASVGTATPDRQYSQEECWEAISASPQFSLLQRRSQTILKRVLLGSNGVSARYLALNSLAEAFELTPDALHRRFSLHAPRLATAAAKDGLRKAGLEPQDVDALIISTCTGYLCPGLTSYVSEALGLRPDALLLDLVGQGCGAALPNLRTANSLVQAGQHKRVLSVCVEVCSAALFMDDDPGVLISACLFGDGAGAAVLCDERVSGQRSVEWIDFSSRLCAEDREFLRFDHRNGMLRNILAPEVPGKAAAHARAVLEQVLERQNLKLDDIGQWVTHAGGREVLKSIGKELSLPDHAFQQSWDVLDQHGNISSPFVLFVLNRALSENTDSGWWWMNSFGAGFTSHGALLRVGQSGQTS